MNSEEFIAKGLECGDIKKTQKQKKIQKYNRNAYRNTKD
jgi:hypothetical protein